jgi:hypothetical protein
MEDKEERTKGSDQSTCFESIQHAPLSFVSSILDGFLSPFYFPLSLLYSTPMSTDEKTIDSFKESSSPLPTPVSASPPKPKLKLTATAIIPVWIVLSSSVIIYNNYLYNTLAFPYPVFTVTWHLFFAAIGTRILQRTTHLLDGAKEVRMDMSTFVRRILPIGLLFSGSLILSNTAYLYLSVSYIQMLKVRGAPF